MKTVSLMEDWKFSETDPKGASRGANWVPTPTACATALPSMHESNGRCAWVEEPVVCNAGVIGGVA